MPNISILFIKITNFYLLIQDFIEPILLIKVVEI
jgi:hypothetical protein